MCAHVLVFYFNFAVVRAGVVDNDDGICLLQFHVIPCMSASDCRYVGLCAGGFIDDIVQEILK